VKAVERTQTHASKNKDALKRLQSTLRQAAARKTLHDRCIKNEDKKLQKYIIMETNETQYEQQ
jgi:hypothetical protein